MCSYTGRSMPAPGGAIYLDYSVNDFFRPAASNLASPGLGFHNLGVGGGESTHVYFAVVSGLKVNAK